MKKNILIVGVSGAGKSTLVNAIAGQTVAEVTKGDAATQQITTYKNDSLDFNIVDTRGFEFNVWNQNKIMKSLSKLIKKGLGTEDDEKEESEVISCIWYCVEATNGRLHKENIQSLLKLTKPWKDVPVIVVLTKSYAKPQNAENIKMVQEQFDKHGPSANLKEIIPIVAIPYEVDDDYMVSQYGVEQLIEKTNEILKVVNEKEAQESFRNKQRRKKAEMLVTAYAGGAGTVGAVPIPLADAPILAALETHMIHQLGKTYKISEETDDENTVERVFKSLITAGTVGAIAKTSLSAIKSLPGINLAASALNAVMAATVVEMLGQMTILLFENIKSGKISLDKYNEVETLLRIM